MENAIQQLQENGKNLKYAIQNLLHTIQRVVLVIIHFYIGLWLIKYNNNMIVLFLSQSKYCLCSFLAFWDITRYKPCLPPV